MRLRKPQKSLPGALTLSLALWIGILPFLSALHLAIVLHVYCPEHHHLHEVVTVGEVAPAKDTAQAIASIFSQSSTSSLTTLEECPFTNLALRQGVVTSQSTNLTLIDCGTQQNLPLPTANTSWPILSRAPKHSPPFQAA